VYFGQGARQLALGKMVEDAARPQAVEVAVKQGEVSHVHVKVYARWHLLRGHGEHLSRKVHKEHPGSPAYEISGVSSVSAPDIGQ
jgi:hypothetical protein